MKTLVDYINEGNIANDERKYREFSQMCMGYNTNVDEVSVRKTTKNNWAVYKGDKRIFTASSNILDQGIVEKYGIKLKQED
jgi:hypothetical protein